MAKTTVPIKQIADEACDWALKLNAGTLGTEERRALAAWLKTSKLHVDEFLLAVSMYEAVGATDPKTLPAALDHLAEDAGKVVALGATATIPDKTAPSEPSKTPKWIVPGFAAAAAFVAVLFFAISMFMWSSDDGVIEVATALGEQRTVPLDDSSVVDVNTQTTIRIRFTEDERMVELVRGEAFFDVKRDPTRPFKVIAGDTITEAIGTTFNVRYIDDRAEVSVVEGTVAFAKTGVVFDTVDNAPAPDTQNRIPADMGRVEQGRLILTAGERAGLAETATAPRVAAVNLEAVTSWRRRQLVFDDETLATIAAEFNRYNRQRLIVSSPDLEMIRLSGVFDADDPQSFVAFLQLAGDFEVTEIGENLHLDRP